MKVFSSLFIFSFLVCSKAIQAQPEFISPIDTPLVLSGNFGEPRGSHFHAGIDISTNGKIGIPVKAAESGIIYRIKVSNFGYGKAVYIKHHNGYTTVYGHLSAFTNEIEEYIERHQYKKRSFEVELFPTATMFKVKKGQIIAYSGNSGSSEAPHLHFEIRESKTEEVLDPSNFNLFEDTVTPVLESLVVYQLRDALELSRPALYLIIRPADSNWHKLTIPEGRYVFGVSIRDYVKGYNHFLYPTSLDLHWNNEKLYARNTHRFTFKEARFVPAAIDYPLSSIHNSYYEKCFWSNGIQNLRFVDVSSSNGIVEVKSTGMDTLKINISDAHGNTAVHKMLVSGSVASSTDSFQSLCTQKGNVEVFPGLTNTYSDENCTVDFGLQAFFEPVQLNVSSWLDEDAFPVVRIDNLGCDQKVNTKIGLSINIPSHLIDYNLSKKFYIKCSDDESSVGVVSNNQIKTFVRNTGTFTIDVDTTAPLIKNLEWSKLKICAEIFDLESGIESYTAYVDNAWFLMEYDPNTGKICGKLSKFPVNQKLDFKLIVRDKVGNLTEIKKTIKK